MEIFRLRTALPRARKLVANQDGVVALELALLLPVLMILLVMSTDYALIVLAQNQVDAAAEAAAQYVLVNGWDGTAAGRQAISNAGVNAFRTPIANSSPVITTITIDPTTDIVFDCATTTGGNYSSQGSYSTSSACSSVGGVPHATVTSHGTYRPFFPAWWSNLVNGVISMQASATTRFQ